MEPMSEQQANEMLANTEASIVDYGLWEKVCTNCGEVVGGRLAEYGQPSEQSLSYCICPHCHCAGKEHKIVCRYVPGKPS